MSKKADRVINEALVVPVVGSGYTPAKMTWITNFIDKTGTAPKWTEVPDLPSDFIDRWYADQGTTGTDPITNWNAVEGSTLAGALISYVAGDVTRGPTFGSITTSTGTWTTIKHDGVEQALRGGTSSSVGPGIPNGGECTWAFVCTVPNLKVGAVNVAANLYSTTFTGGQYFGSYSAEAAGLMAASGSTRVYDLGFQEGDLVVYVVRCFVDGVGGVSTSQTFTQTINGIDLHRNQAGTQTGQRLANFGANYSGGFPANTDALEMIAWNRPLSDQEMSDVSANLMAKYGIT